MGAPLFERNGREGVEFDQEVGLSAHCAIFGLFGGDLVNGGVGLSFAELKIGILKINLRL